MKKQERARLVHDVLNELFPEPTIPLDHVDPYTMLVAVMLSAQCTDKRVNEITPRLFARACTPEQMVQLDVQEIETIIRPCGLAPTKARAIWQTSQLLIERHGGEVPATFEELEALPGVGHKTASVVMAQVHRQPAFPVDTHIHRCAKRWGLSSGKSVVQTEVDLKRLFPRRDWIRLHLQIIYFARQHCQARGHQPELCPICSELMSSRLTTP